MRLAIRLHGRKTPWGRQQNDRRRNAGGRRGPEKTDSRAGFVVQVGREAFARAAGLAARGRAATAATVAAAAEVTAARPQPPPAPSPRPPSMVSSPRNFCRHDLGGVLLDAGLVGPFAGLDRALDVNRRALASGSSRPTFTRLSLKITTRCHSVFSLRSPRGAVAPGLEVATRRLATRSPSLRAADFGVGSKVADQNDLVDAARHRGRRAAPATNAPASRRDVNGFLKVKWLLFHKCSWTGGYPSSGAPCWAASLPGRPGGRRPCGPAT